MKKIAIVGRANVGKSTFFNRFSKNIRAITKPTPGVTRDRVISQVKWRDLEFELIDTGGLTFKASGIEGSVDEQAKIAMQDADMIFVMVDVSAPITEEDDKVARLVKTSGKEAVVILNKLDRITKHREIIYDFYKLGFENMFTVSSEHNQGFTELMKFVYGILKEGGEPKKEIEKAQSKRKIAKEKIEEERSEINIAIVGRPNVGKSSLVNSLTGVNRSIVSSEAGTTRDTISSTIEFRDRKLVLLDTAGIRRKSKVYEDIEYYSVVRAIRSMQKTDVVILMLSIEEMITEQDTKIVGLAKESLKPIVVAVNKVDIEKLKRDDKEKIAERLKFIKAPIIPISALTKKGLDKLLEKVIHVHSENNKRISTGVLNEVLREITRSHEPPMKRGRRVKLTYITQVKVAPPTFIVFSNYPEGLHFSYVRRIENGLRHAFGFEGVEIRVIVKNSRSQ